MEAVSTSISLLQGLLDASPDAITVYQAVRDAGGQIVDMRLTMLNQQSARTLGLSAGAVVGRLFSALSPAATYAERFDWLREVAQTGRPLERELATTRPDETTVWLRASLRRFEEYVVITYSDITDRERAEAEKQAQTDLLENVFASSLVGITLFEPLRDAGGKITDFRLVRINDTGLSIIRRTRAEITGKTLKQINPATMVSGLFNEYVTVCETNVPLVDQERYYAQDDCWYALTAKCIESGLVLTYQDITDRKRAELDQQAQTDLLEGILASSLLGIAVYQPLRDAGGTITDFRLVRINEAGLRMPGNLTDVTGRTLKELYPATETDGLFRHYVAVCETGEPYQTEHYYSGYAMWFAVMITRISDGIVVTYQDITERRQTEQQLAQQAGLFAGVLKSLLNGLIVFRVVRDGQGRLADLYYEAVSESVVRDTGLPREQLVGQSILTLFPGVRQSAYWPAYEAALATGEGQQFEDHYVYDGIDNHSFAQVTPLGSDRLISLYQLTNDLKLAQRTAQAQADLLTSVINTSPTGLILADPVRDDAGVITDFIYRLTNDFNARLVGKSVEEMVGRRIETHFPGWQQLALFRGMKEVCETGQPQQHTEKLEGYGLNCWLEYHYRKHGEGVLVTFLDVTTLIEAQLAQQRQADLLQSVVGNSPAGLVLFEAVRDEAGEVIDFVYKLTNDANAATTGRSVDEMTGSRWLALFPHYKGTATEQLFREVLETGQPRQLTLEAEHAGRRQWVEGSFVKQGDGVLFTFLDVTALKEAQLAQQQQAAALEAANRELARSNDNLESFAYVASHDLQEPLRKIESFGNLLSARFGTELGDEGQTYISRMQASAARMSVLIKDLLTYSRLATQQEPFYPVDLSVLVAQVLDDLEVAVREAGATVTVGTLPTVRGDALQLRQLVQNLLGNALKFRRPDVAPVVQITSRVVGGADLPVALQPAETGGPSVLTYHEISVSDNGIGFEPHHAERIFQVFQRLHGRSQYAGSGVGLSITKRVAENHGGTIVAESQPGEGATFRVYLQRE